MAVIHKYITKNGIVEQEITPMQAIRAKCMECSNYQYHEVRLCQVKDCPLYPYRFGKRPK